jgi:hypothetical protein
MGGSGPCGKLAAKRPKASLAELCHRPGNSGQQATIRQPQVVQEFLGRVKDQPRADPSTIK